MHNKCHALLSTSTARQPSFGACGSADSCVIFASTFIVTGRFPVISSLHVSSRRLRSTLRLFTRPRSLRR